MLGVVDSDNGSSGITGTATMNPTLPIWNEDRYRLQSPHLQLQMLLTLWKMPRMSQMLIPEYYVLGTVGAKLNLINTAKQTLSTTANYTIDFNSNKTYYYLPSTHATSAWNGYAGQSESW